MHNLFIYSVTVGIALSNDLAKVLEEEIDPPTRKHNLNLVKMTCYLLCQYMEMLESDETKPSTNQVITKVKHLPSQVIGKPLLCIIKQKSSSL